MSQDAFASGQSQRRVVKRWTTFYEKLGLLPLGSELVENEPLGLSLDKLFDEDRKLPGNVCLGLPWSY